MNRGQRRRIRRIAGDRGRTHVVEATGVGLATARRRLPDSPPPGGDHRWVVSAVWRLSPEAAAAHACGVGEQVHLDLENLIAIDGPGCWVCEQIWSAAIATEPCPGDPAGGALQADREER